MKFLKKMSYQPGWYFAVPFFAVMGVLTIVGFLLPLRPQRSYAEKRELAKFPAFSVESLMDGDYFEQISLWFSDTFPGRESWISLAALDDAFYGYSEIYIDGELPMTQTVPLILDPLESATVPSWQEPTGQEMNQQIATMETIAQAETESLAQTGRESAQPEGWGGVNAGDAAEIIRDITAFQIGDAAFIYQNFSQETSDGYARILNELAQKVQDKGVTVVSAPAPTAVGVLIEDEYQQKLGSVSQVKILQYIRSRLDSRVVTVDTASTLIPHNNEYLFFRTDHHWTALGAYYCYQAVCDAIGVEAVELSTMEPWDQGTFKGSLYGRVKQVSKLRPDTVTAYIPNGDIRYEVFYSEGFPTEMPLLMDATNRTEFEKYLVFGTDYPMTHAENRSLPDAPNCMVVKDSFGNCFVPFLTQSFHNVYAIDYRKYTGTPVADLVEKYDIDYVIVMPYITAIQDSLGPDMFRRICLQRW